MIGLKWNTYIALYTLYMCLQEGTASCQYWRASSTLVSKFVDNAFCIDQLVTIQFNNLIFKAEVLHITGVWAGCEGVVGGHLTHIRTLLLQLLYTSL